MGPLCADPALPSHSTIYRWLKAHPGFRADYALARLFQRDRLIDEAWTVAAAATPETAAVAQLRLAAIRAKAAKIAPKRWSWDYVLPHAPDPGFQVVFEAKRS